MFGGEVGSGGTVCGDSRVVFGGIVGGSGIVCGVSLLLFGGLDGDILLVGDDGFY